MILCIFLPFEMDKKNSEDLKRVCYENQSHNFLSTPNLAVAHAKVDT